jgi:hypothetical protein
MKRKKFTKSIDMIITMVRKSTTHSCQNQNIRKYEIKIKLHSASQIEYNMKLGGGEFVC